MREAEAMTAGNNRFMLQIAANYGGQWDIAGCPAAGPEVQAGHLRPEDITPNVADLSGNRRAAVAGPCASAPVASTASAISCCGSWPIPSCILRPVLAGLQTRCHAQCLADFASVSVASVKRASRSKLEPGV
jgi:hypothetical protein